MFQEGKKIQVVELGPPKKYRNKLWNGGAQWLQAGAIRHHSQKSTIPDDCNKILDFLLGKAFFWHGLIHPHAGAYM